MIRHFNFQDLSVVCSVWETVPSAGHQFKTATSSWRSALGPAEHRLSSDVLVTAPINHFTNLLGNLSQIISCVVGLDNSKSMNLFLLLSNTILGGNKYCMRHNDNGT